MAGAGPFLYTRQNHPTAKADSNPIDSIRLSSIGSAHADLVPISLKVLLLRASNIRFLFVTARCNRALRTNTRVRYLIDPSKIGRRRIIGERQVAFVLPRAGKGKKDPKNLVAACRPCNRIKGRLVFASFEEAKKNVVERRAELRSEWETTMDQLRGKSAKA